MDSLIGFIQLGLRHILDPNGLDHVLFLVALAACYRPKDWRHGLAVVSAFTVGHSLTLGLAVVGLVGVSSELVEFLIPITIVLAGLENLLDLGRSPRGWRRPLLAGGFGLIHGAGFASYLRSLFSDQVAVPLLGFNLGLEVGQAVVLAITVASLAFADRLLGAGRSLGPGRRHTELALAVRTLATTAVVVTVAGRMALERTPW
ncbi:MAG TPA: HupE/UreJ family protein [Gemmatimonadales bacterium]